MKSKQLALLTALFCPYVESVCYVSRGETGDGDTGKRDHRHRSRTGCDDKRRIVEIKRWYNNLPRWSRHKRHLVEGEPVEPTLKKLRVVITLTTTTDTSAIHGEYTDLREAVAYLRKLADEIEIELQREPRSTFNPSS